MSPDHQRIVDLEDHLTISTTLLKENEDELRLAATPRERAYYKREIERIRGAITEYREELDALRNDNVLLSAHRECRYYRVYFDCEADFQNSCSPIFNRLNISF